MKNRQSDTALTIEINNMLKKKNWVDDIFEVAAAAVALAPAAIAGGVHAGYKLLAEDSNAAKTAFGSTFDKVVDGAAEFGKEHGKTFATTVILGVMNKQAQRQINNQIDKRLKS